MKPVIDLLVCIGLVRVTDGKVRWPFSVWPWEWWKIYFFNPGWSRNHDPQIGGWFCMFRNLPGVRKWTPGRLLPRRWGFRVLGIEVGDRG